MMQLVVILITGILINPTNCQYPDCITCTDGEWYNMNLYVYQYIALYTCTGSIPLTPLSYNIRNSDAFNGAQPSNDSAILADCDQGFDGGDYSDLSSTFSWSRTSSEAQQVSIVFKFHQHISINRISMFFWNSPNYRIRFPTVTVAFADHNMQFTYAGITTSSPSRSKDGRSVLNISINNNNLKFQYLRIRMSFTDNSEWIFLGEVQFCGE